MSRKVQGTMQNVPSIEVGADTVYIRTNIRQVNSDDFSGWEYDEEQYNIKEYIEKLACVDDTQSIAILISMLMGEIDTLRNRVDILEGGSV